MVERSRRSVWWRDALAAGVAAVAFVFFGLQAAWADEPNANAVSLATRDHPMTLALDARQAARGIMFAHLTLPVKPGPFTFVYPKWIPGEHAPSGPLGDLAALRVTAGGSALAWSRDQVDLYAFHVEVPPQTLTIDVDFDVLLNAPQDEMSTSHLAVVNWNRDLVYQQDTNSADVYLQATIRLPAGWDYATALSGASRSGDTVSFGETSLETLVDSPLDCGQFARHILIWSNGPSTAWLDVFADAPEDLDLTPEAVAPYRKMVPEALAMFGARHWNSYHALVVLTDDIPENAIEHHESSDDRLPEAWFASTQEALTDGDTIMHEFAHSWNGKYRRPTDLTTANYQIPMQTDLLWVYEGLNQYLGDLLSFRTGVRAPASFPEYLARQYASLDAEPGRLADPLVDTAVAAPYLYYANGQYPSLRRGTDFYNEGELIWLDADTIIREQTHGGKSLDDFLRAYAGLPDSGPMVITYTREDIERLLNSIAPYPWHDFFERWVYDVAPHPPADEFRRAGWELAYSATPNAFGAADEQLNHSVDLWYSLGLQLGDDGTVNDVRDGSPAWHAGLGPGMKVLAVDQRTFNADIARAALVHAQHSSAPIALLVKNQQWYRTYLLDYYGGPRYPHLIRIAHIPDMLGSIAAARAHP